MKHAETVTFGGSGLPRMAELRGQQHEIDRLLAQPDSRMILFWRGKLLLRETAAGFDLVRLELAHPVRQEASVAPIFLGQEDAGAAGAVFACDISGWSPADLDQAALQNFNDSSRQHHPALAAGMEFVELRSAMAALSPRDAELAATARALFNWHNTHGFCARCGSASAVAMAGWQRNCPDCGAMHFPRTDPVVIMLITHGNRVLLGRSPGWPEGMFSLLAGFVEPGETLEAAVRREVAEETGVAVGPVSYLASQPWAFPNSLMIGCRGEASSTEITIDPHEIEAADWFSREEIMMAMAGRHPKLKPTRNGAIAQFLLRNWLADRLD